MRTIVIISFLIFGVQLAIAQQCEKPRVGEERQVCSEATVVFSKEFTTSQLAGVVLSRNGEAIPGSIIEVYEARKDGALVSTYKTDKNGRFCVKELKEGKYILKAGWNKPGYNCTELTIKISGKTKRLLEVTLELG